MGGLYPFPLVYKLLKMKPKSYYNKCVSKRYFFDKVQVQVCNSLDVRIMKSGLGRVAHIEVDTGR